MPVKKIKKIYIDFQGGSHGNFLEFVCNRFLAGTTTASALPFNHLHAAHDKQYLTEPMFKCDHFTTYGIALTNETVISIQIEPDDLLPLQCVSLLRAGDRNIKPEALETDTYYKLHNSDYQSVLDNLLHRFFSDQDMLAAYRAIADPSWPEINSRQDYSALPETIRRECEETHGFFINTLDPDHPDCPRDILVEFFQIGFSNPTEHGFIKTQANQRHTNCVVYQFPFGCLYDEDRFQKEMIGLSHFLEMPFDSHNKDFIHLHREFLRRQPYKDAKNKCDELINRVWLHSELEIFGLDVIQEAYVRSMLSKRKAS